MLFSYPDGVHSQDLESALTYSLRHEVAGRKVIEGDDLHALKAYVLVLSKVGNGYLYNCILSFVSDLFKLIRSFSDCCGFNYVCLPSYGYSLHMKYLLVYY